MALPVLLLMSEGRRLKGCERCEERKQMYELYLRQGAR